MDGAETLSRSQRRNQKKRNKKKEMEEFVEAEIPPEYAQEVKAQFAAEMQLASIAQPFVAEMLRSDTGQSLQQHEWDTAMVKVGSYISLMYETIMHIRQGDQESQLKQGDEVSQLGGSRIQKDTKGNKELSESDIRIEERSIPSMSLRGHHESPADSTDGTYEELWKQAEAIVMANDGTTNLKDVAGTHSRTVQVFRSLKKKHKGKEKAVSRRNHKQMSGAQKKTEKMCAK